MEEEYYKDSYTFNLHETVESILNELDILESNQIDSLMNIMCNLLSTSYTVYKPVPISETDNHRQRFLKHTCSSSFNTFMNICVIVRNILKEQIEVILLTTPSIPYWTSNITTSISSIFRKFEFTNNFNACINDSTKHTFIELMQFK